MELKKIGRRSSRAYNAVFRGEETTVIAAAYKEQVYAFAEDKRIGDITVFAIEAAQWSEGVQKEVPLNEENRIARTLMEFYERTYEAISAIPDITGTPPFKNEDIARRLALGQLAGSLAQEINEKIVKVEMRDIESLPEIRER